MRMAVVVARTVRAALNAGPAAVHDGDGSALTVEIHARTHAIASHVRAHRRHCSAAQPERRRR